MMGWAHYAFGFSSSIPDPLQVGQVMETLSFPEPEQEMQDM